MAWETARARRLPHVEVEYERVYITLFTYDLSRSGPVSPESYESSIIFVGIPNREWLRAFRLGDGPRNPVRA
jgi:hypothetical protein